MIEISLLFLGLAGLWFGTELVIKGAVDIAEYYQISQVFVGIAILAVGTDLPEIVIATNAAIEMSSSGVDTSGLIIGNAIGSSISQLSVVLGVAGLLGYLRISKQHLYEDGIMLLGSIILLILFSLDGTITQIEGAAMIIVYVIYYGRLLYQERIVDKMKKRAESSLWKSISALILGMIVVIYASELVVDNAIQFSEQMNIEQSFVGIILIGLGTSLPELALSLTAVRKKAGGLSVGNLIGSNIFDTLMPIGVGSAIVKLNFDPKMSWFDLPFLLVISVVVLFFFRKKKGLQKKEALSLVILFLSYATLKLFGL